MPVIWQAQRSFPRNQAAIRQNTAYNSLTHIETCVSVKQAVSFQLMCPFMSAFIATQRIQVAQDFPGSGLKHKSKDGTNKLWNL